MSTYNITRKGLGYIISKPLSTIKIIRLPYNNIKSFDYQSFLVYILVKNNNIYVGKSKNGVLNRPTSHTNNWDLVYFIIDESNLFNDGIIQYLENVINNKINLTDAYNNQTQLTNRDTINESEYEYISHELNEIYYMLYGLGLDLIHEKEYVYRLDSGKYEVMYKSIDSKLCRAYILVNQDIILLKDSEINNSISSNLDKELISMRQNEIYVDLNIIQKDIKFNNILDAISFIYGRRIKSLDNIRIRAV